jgi:hypothetical protein
MWPALARDPYHGLGQALHVGERNGQVRTPDRSRRNTTALRVRAAGNRAGELGFRGSPPRGGGGLGCPHDRDRLVGGPGRLWPGAVPGVLDPEVGHLALDDPGVGTLAAVDQEPAQLGDRVDDRAGKALRGKTRPGR